MCRTIECQRSIVGRLQRELDRGATSIGSAVYEALSEALNKTRRIVAQSGRRKAADEQPRFHARHAPEVDCISKGKARQPCEFGVKVGIASTLHSNLIGGARAFQGKLFLA